jgi:hypothetical protein
MLKQLKHKQFIKQNIIADNDKTIEVNCVIQSDKNKIIKIRKDIEIKHIVQPDLDE